MLLPLAQFPVLLLVQHSPTLPSHTPIPNQTQRIPLLTYLLTIADKLTVFFDNAKEKMISGCFRNQFWQGNIYQLNTVSQTRLIWTDTNLSVPYYDIRVVIFSCSNIPESRSSCLSISHQPSVRNSSEEPGKSLCNETNTYDRYYCTSNLCNISENL